MLDYSLFAYGGMIGPNSTVRVDAYAEALRRTVTPDSVVLEIGAGPGFFSLLAARFGARHVYAVDPNPTVKLGPQLAAANGVADQITFIQKLSTDVELPEPADVLVSDIRGALPWLTHHIPSIVDARGRLLGPDAVLIPRRDTVWATVVDAPTVHAPHVAPWDDNDYGLDLSLARERTTNHQRKARFAADDMVVEPQLVATLEYGTISDPNASAQLDWEVADGGTGRGLALWFETELLPGIEYSNRPGEPPIPIYAQTFFPWSEPVDLAPGDRVRVDFRARLAGGRYVFSWHTRVDDPAADRAKARFAQASFARGVVSGDDGDQLDEPEAP